MQEKNAKELLEYLKTAIEIETDIATQENIIARYTLIAEEKKPQLVEKKLPEKPYVYVNSGGNDSLFGGVAMVVGGIVFAIILVAAEIDLLAYLSLAASLLGILCIFEGIQLKNEHARQEESYEFEMRKYQTLYDKLSKENKDNRKHFTESSKAWDESNTQMKGYLNTPLKQTKEVLKKYYLDSPLYPKYHNLPALTSIYEYLITGRCESLTGPYGAYNLYEDEIRKDTVISQLSVVIENLEQIKQNQYMLYQQVNEIQKTADSIEDELRQLKGHTIDIVSLTALNAYYSALTERNTRITMWHNL